jgi:D-3-phosphoglycerate dehydrogenase
MKIMIAGEYPIGTYERLRRELSMNQKNEIIKIDTKEQYDNMTEAEIIILRIFKASKEIIERNKNLKMILRWGAGYDTVDIETAGKKGIIVTNTPGANADAVSELTILLMLAVGRNILQHVRCLEKGEWSKNTFLNTSYTLKGKLVGIIGGGNIGRKVAEKVHIFGAKIQYYDAYRLTPEIEEKYQMQYVPMNQLLKTSDVITLHVPLNESTHNIIGKEQIGQMKQNVIFINVSRGGLVDEKELLSAIENRKILGAGIDCVEKEPLNPNDSMLKNPAIIITPHIGGGTADLQDAIIPMIVKNIKSFLEGNQVDYVVNNDWLKYK